MPHLAHDLAMCKHALSGARLAVGLMTPRTPHPSTFDSRFSTWSAARARRSATLLRCDAMREQQVVPTFTVPPDYGSQTT